MADLLRITAPHFCAGAIFRDGLCAEAAPIIGWMRGKSRDWVEAYCQRKGWQWDWLYRVEKLPRS